MMIECPHCREYDIPKQAQQLADKLWNLLPDTGAGDITVPNLLARQIYQYLRQGQYD
jgi:hypothetical protein